LTGRGRRGEQRQDTLGGVRGTPTTFLVDRRGMIVQRFEGEPDFGKLGVLIEREL